MWIKLLRQALLAPAPMVIFGWGFWRKHHRRIRRARVLCQSADGLRLRRVRNWEIRSDRLYHRATYGLQGLAEIEVDAAEDWARTASRMLARAEQPIRALAAGLVEFAGALAVTTSIIVLVGCAFSTHLRSRLFPDDLAEGKPWTASSTESGYPSSGSGPSSEGNLFFHTPIVDSPYVEIDLGAEHIIRSVLVENRTDCCQNRALPLDVKVLEGDTWQLVAERRSPFSTWRYDIAPVRARKIRFQRPSSDYFHLKRISVYGQ